MNAIEAQVPSEITLEPLERETLRRLRVEWELTSDASAVLDLYTFSTIPGATKRMEFIHDSGVGVALKPGSRPAPPATP